MLADQELLSVARASVYVPMTLLELRQHSNSRCKFKDNCDDDDDDDDDDDEEGIEGGVVVVSVVEQSSLW